MRRFGVAVLLPWMLLTGGAVAQNPLEGMSTETHSNSDVSSNSAMMAAMRTPVTGEAYEADKVTRSVWTLADEVAWEVGEDGSATRAGATSSATAIA